MVEIVDGVLQVLKEGLVPLALGRDVGHGPERGLALRRMGERAHADAVPRRRARSRQRRGEPHLLHRRPARARCLAQPVDRLGDFRRARKQPLDIARRPARPAQRPIGRVGVKHARGARGDEIAVLAAFGDFARQIIFARAPDEAHQTRRIHDDAEGAEHREPRNRHRDRAPPQVAGREHQRGGGGHHGQQHEDDEAGAHESLQSPVAGRRGKGRHERKTASLRRRRSSQAKSAIPAPVEHALRAGQYQCFARRLQNSRIRHSNNEFMRFSEPRRFVNEPSGV